MGGAVWWGGALRGEFIAAFDMTGWSWWGTARPCVEMDNDSGYRRWITAFGSIPLAQCRVMLSAIEKSRLFRLPTFAWSKDPSTRRHSLCSRLRLGMTGWVAGTASRGIHRYALNDGGSCSGVAGGH